MKQVIFFEILRKLKSKPALMRKVKIFVTVGIVGFVLVGGLTIWAGFTAVKYAVIAANEIVSSPATQNQLNNVRAELQQIQFQPQNCWGKAQSLMTVQPWLEKPALDNLQNLKVACLDAKPAACQGHNCSTMNQIVNTYDGSTI